MEISISLPENDVEFIDYYMAEYNIVSRSAVIRYAISLLRQVELEKSYKSAWNEREAEI